MLSKKGNMQLIKNENNILLNSDTRVSKSNNRMRENYYVKYLLYLLHACDSELFTI